MWKHTHPAARAQQLRPLRPPLTPPHESRRRCAGVPGAGRAPLSREPPDSPTDPRPTRDARPRDARERDNQRRQRETAGGRAPGIIPVNVEHSTHCVRGLCTLALVSLPRYARAGSIINIWYMFTRQAGHAMHWVFYARADHMCTVSGDGRTLILVHDVL